MTMKNKKQFGVWMDSHHATIAGRTADNDAFEIIGHIKNEGAAANSNEKSSNNSEQGLLHKFFKEIAATMLNAEEVHVTGTGTAQEQFIHYLKETPQFKNIVAKETTSNKMSDEKLVAFIEEKFN